MARKIQVGQTAPQFEVSDVFGKRVKLSDFKTKNTLVVFLRYAGCPFCNLALHRLVLEQDRFKAARCEIVAFIESSTENIIENIYHRHQPKPKFPVIGDPRREVYDLYDVKTSVKALFKSITKLPYWIHSVQRLGFKQAKIDGNWLSVPATFLISEGGQKVLSASYSSDFYDNETFTKMYEELLFGRVN